MNPFAKAKNFSKRSQASLAEQCGLENELHKNEAWLRVVRDNIEKLSKSVADIKHHMATDGSVLPSHLGDMVRELDNEKIRLSVHQEHAEGLRERIKKLELPSRADAGKRLKAQQALAAIAAQRLEVDREIGAVVGQLRASLDQRAELCARMHAHAAELGFSDGADLLDERRFDALRESLPPDLAEKSAEWATSFAGGKPKGTLRCTVLKALTLPETLAHSGCYSAGDEVFLAPDRAAELAASGEVQLPKEYAPARWPLNAEA